MSRPKVLPIVQLGHPTLHKRARLVKKVRHSVIQKIVADMLHTYRRLGGVGRAAPQVNQSLRIMIVSSHPNPRYPKAPVIDPIVMINPKILWLSNYADREWGWEGCFSIPGIFGQVLRHREMRVKFLTPSGETQTMNLSGLLARVFQHEFDHLEGITFLDHLLKPGMILISGEELTKQTDNKKRTDKKRSRRTHV